jgi:poly(ribitol-phosphate) beta-N-acetylglucosaminyltransferase
VAGDVTGSPAAVSVIVPVWNVEPYLRQCLDSVVGQSIGLDRLEVLAVDDGSTDTSGAILDEYAARYAQVRVVHEPNSGGPGRPRNIGLDRATGRFVFFLDADDYLGPEALERLVAMAERNESDIVLARLVGIDGRRMRTHDLALEGDLDRVPLELAFTSTSVLKLFSRSFLKRVGVRFGEGVQGGEDGDFMAPTYLAAEVISQVGSYPCYYARGRPGSQSRRGDRTDDLAEVVNRVERERIAPVVERRGAGTGRDALLRGQLQKIATLFRDRWRSMEPDERRRVFDAGAATARRWSGPRIRGSLPAWVAIRLYCLEHGLIAELEDIVATPPDIAFSDPVVEGRRVFARWPHFRAAAGIPDQCFDITPEIVPQVRLDQAELVDGHLVVSGEAFLRLVGGTSTIELRRWPRGDRWSHDTTVVPTPDLRAAARPYPRAGFSATIDLATIAAGKPLPRGTWSVYLTVGTERIHRTVPVASRRWGPAAAGSQGGGIIERNGLYRSGAGMLRLRVGRASAVLGWIERLEASILGAGRRAMRWAARSPLRRVLPRGMRGRASALVKQLGED